MSQIEFNIFSLLSPSVVANRYVLADPFGLTEKACGYSVIFSTSAIVEPEISIVLHVCKGINNCEQLLLLSQCTVLYGVDVES